MTTQIQTFELAGRWIAKLGNFVAFGVSEEEVTYAVNNPQGEHVQDSLVTFSEDEWRILSEFAMDSESRKPFPVPTDPTLGTYAILTPAGRKYGTWAVMRQSSRASLTWDIVMPDVGTRENAARLVTLLNTQGAEAKLQVAFG